MDPTPAPTPLRGRPQASAPRRRQILVRVSDGELSVIKAGALCAGLAVGAWLRGVAVSSADRPDWGLAMSRRDVIGQLLRVRVDVAQVVHAADSEVARSLAREALRHLDALIGEVVNESSG